MEIKNRDLDLLPTPSLDYVNWKSGGRVSGTEDNVGEVRRNSGVNSSRRLSVEILSMTRRVYPLTRKIQSQEVSHQGYALIIVV